MPKFSTSLLRRSFLLLVLTFAGVLAVFVLSKGGPSHAAASARSSSGSERRSFPNYDIRTDKTAFDKLAGFRTAINRRASETADFRESMARAEKGLKESVPTLKVEYNNELGAPEVIAPGVLEGRAILERSSGGRRSDVLKDFLNRNSELVGARGSQISELKVAADYTNPDGNLSFVELKQEINGIPVFRGEVKAGFTRTGAMFRIVNNLAPGLEYTTLSTDFGDPRHAVAAAAKFIGADLAESNLALDRAASEKDKAIFGTGDSATTAEKMYFPTEAGVAIPAWRVLIWQPSDAYYVIVDAKSGTMLWRKNITEDQSQPATYSVYTNPNAMINVAQSPFPFSPGPIAPNGSQGIAIPRSTVSRIGNEAPYTFNQLGWIADGGTRTDGNAVQAGLDRDGTDGVDPNSEAVSSTREFTFDYTPLDPNTNMGEAPVPATGQAYPGTTFQQGTVTQLFYVSNWYHDETYRLGFTEAAGNFQNVNFTGEGLAGDRIRAEGQDSGNVNNANFSTPGDGTRPRLQMYIWNGPTPDIDGSLDASLVIHELTHGLSNRLHGDGSGLTNDMSRGMGEGWSDFYGLAMLSQPNDPLDGVYATSTYSTYRVGGSFLNNGYYGIRRFPTAIKTAVGGPNGRPHNPLTFADVDSTQIDLSDGAFSARFIGNADQVHNIGEVWCSALWEIRARMISRLGWSEGNRRILQFVTDGMKLAPLSPTLVGERDAIIAAGLASGTPADVADMWAGFRARGLGAGASVQNAGGTSTGGTGTARVTESFAAPNLTQNPGFGVSDFLGNNNNAFDQGETITLNIPLTNSTGNEAAGVTLQVVGGSTASYGTISHGQRVERAATFRIPDTASCGSVLTLTFNVNSSLGPVSFTGTIAVGAPQVTFSEKFDAVTPPAVPIAWTVTSGYAPMTFVTTASSSDSAPNSMFAADLPNCSGGGCPTTNGGSTELTSPPIVVQVAASTMSFRHKYNTEPGFDGGVIEIRRGDALQPWEDILTAGGTFLQNGYNGTLGSSAPNPLGGRAAWSGDSGGYITTVIRLPQSAVGQVISLRWRFGTDNNTAPVGGGWNVDSIQVVGDYTCNAAGPVRSRADFDGDGRTDLSVFRATEGNWYLNRSTQGFTGVNFGLASDIPAPGDFDGDGKADIAVWRATDGVWYTLSSSTGTFSSTQFGLAGDIPQSGDFDGDRRDDVAVFRPSNGTWYWQNSGNGQVGGTQFGQNGDLPLAGDYDGDGRDDLVTYRPEGGTWFRLNSVGGPLVATQFGISGDMPVPADYDGDNREDIAVFRPSDGNWYRLNSSNGQFAAVNFGLVGDVPVPGDYDGDGRDDQAVFRAGVWFANRSTSGFFQAAFGLPTDVPIPKKYIP